MMVNEEVLLQPLLIVAASRSFIYFYRWVKISSLKNEHTVSFLIRVSHWGQYYGIAVSIVVEIRRLQ